MITVLRPTSPFRIACVQHGNYLVARRQLAAGGPETYGSQRYSVEAQQQLLAGHPHLVISLDGPDSNVVEGLGQYVCAPAPLPAWVPARLRIALRSQIILRHLKRFAPTHLLLRTNDVLGCQLLSWAGNAGVQTAAIIASRFDPKHGPARQFCKLASAAHVLFVGNHNLVATRSMIECGLPETKAIAWDYPDRISPKDFPAKMTPLASPHHVLFAGNLIEGKGVLDLVEGVRLARRQGLDLHLTVCGEGPLLAGLRAHPGVAEAWLTVTGAVPIQEVWQRMQASWLVAVPTRHSFPEALPLTLIDALATRTPVLLSDHPIFSEFFKPDQATVFFKAASPTALRDALIGLADDPQRHAELSRQTLDVWQGLQIEQTFHGLLERFADITGMAAP